MIQSSTTGTDLLMLVKHIAQKFEALRPAVRRGITRPLILQ